MFRRNKAPRHSAENMPSYHHGANHQRGPIRAPLLLHAFRSLEGYHPDGQPTRLNSSVTDEAERVPAEQIIQRLQQERQLNDVAAPSFQQETSVAEQKNKKPSWRNRIRSAIAGTAIAGALFSPHAPAFAEGLPAVPTPMQSADTLEKLPAANADVLRVLYPEYEDIEREGLKNPNDDGIDTVIMPPPTGNKPMNGGLLITGNEGVPANGIGGIDDDGNYEPYSVVTPDYAATVLNVGQPDVGFGLGDKSYTQSVEEGIAATLAAAEEYDSQTFVGFSQAGEVVPMAAIEHARENPDKHIVVTVGGSPLHPDTGISNQVHNGDHQGLEAPLSAVDITFNELDLDTLPPNMTIIFNKVSKDPYPDFKNFAQFDLDSIAGLVAHYSKTYYPGTYRVDQTRQIPTAGGAQVYENVMNYSFSEMLEEMTGIKLSVPLAQRESSPLPAPAYELAEESMPEYHDPTVVNAAELATTAVELGQQAGFVAPAQAEQLQQDIDTTAEAVDTQIDQFNDQVAATQQQIDQGWTDLQAKINADFAAAQQQFDQGVQDVQQQAGILFQQVIPQPPFAPAPEHAGVN